MKTAAAGAALALAAAIAFWPVVSGERSFFHWDLRYEHVPIWQVTQKALRSGESPFWIDGHYCGNPLLFTQEAPLFYPLTAPLLFTAAPAHRLSDLFTLFHFWLAGFLAYLLLRDLGCDPLSSLFGGIAWMLSARMIQSALWPNAVAVLALLPLALAGVLRICRGRRRSGILAASVAGGLCFLASRPQVLLAIAPLFASVVVGGFIAARRKGTVAVDLALSALLAFALGAPSLLTSAALYPDSSRARGLERSEREIGPLNAENLDLVFLPVDGPDRWPEAAAYPGFLVEFLFAVGIVLTLRRTDGFPSFLFAAVAIGGLIGFLFAFGESGPYRFIAELPLLRGFRVPTRFLASWSLMLSIGAALALSRLVGRAPRGQTIAAVCVIGLAVDLALHARHATSTAPSSVYAIRPDLASAVEKMLTPDEVGFPRRLWSLVGPPFLWAYEDTRKLAVARTSEPIYGSIGMSFGIETIGGAGPPLQRWKQVFQPPEPRGAELGGVGALILPAQEVPPPPLGEPHRVQVQKFAGFPRAIVVPAAIVVPPSKAVAMTLDEKLDLRRVAVLEEGSPLSPASRWNSGEASVRLLSRGPGRSNLAVSLPGEGVLVVFHTFEKGWRATVDGKPQPVLAADAAFQGVRLPPGDHVVELEYRPRGLAAGIAAAAAGVLGLVICAFRLPAS